MFGLFVKMRGVVVATRTGWKESALWYLSYIVGVSGEEVQVMRLLCVSSFGRWLLIQKYVLNSYAKDHFVNFANGQ